MKKAIIAVLAGVFAIAACTKPAPDPELTYSGETEFIVGQDGDIYTINFTSNVAWEAKLDCSGDVATFSGATSGEAGEGKVKVSVMPFNEKDIRTFTLTISAEGVQPIVINFKQTGLPFIKAVEADAEGWIYMTSQETQKSVTIVADKAYSVEFDNKEIESATLTNEGDVYTFTMPDKSYGEVYVKATFATTTDTVVVRCMKAGLLEEVGVVDIPASLMEGAGRYSLAITGGNIIICNTAKMEVYDMTFQKVKDLAFPDGVTFKGITADDAGNVVASAGGAYNADVILYRLAGNNIDGNWESFLTYTNTKSGQGLNALDARGDVFGNGVVSMFQGGVGNAGGISYAVSCQITGGTAGTVTAHSLPFLDGKVLWSSDRCYFYPLGTTEAEGYLYNGYDGTDYKVRHITNDDVITEYLDINTNSNYGNNSMDIVAWNGMKVAATIDMTYFNYCQSRVILINVGGAAPEILTEYAIPAAEEFGANQTTDVQLVPTDDDVTAVFIDGMHKKIGAIKLAKL